MRHTTGPAQANNTEGSVGDQAIQIHSNVELVANGAANPMPTSSSASTTLPQSLRSYSPAAIQIADSQVV